MNSPIPRENDLLRKVDNALESAVRAEGLDWWEPNRVKRVKYAYLAVKEFTDKGEHPITYSWFMYGPGLIASVPQQESLDSGYEIITPKAKKSELHAAGLGKISDYFRQQETLPLHEYWDADNLVFLERFYDICAPEEYRDLYLANIHLRRAFEESLGIISARARNEPIREYERVGTISAKLQIALATDEFDEVREPFLNYTDILEDAFMMLEKKDASQLSSNDGNALRELKAFYRNVAWPAISGIVSEQTAVGPNAERVAKWGRDKTESKLSSFGEELELVKRECSTAGLTPSFEDYPEYTDRLDSKINSAMPDDDNSMTAEDE